MFLTDRDHQIIIAVGRHRRLTTGQIRSLFFDSNSSHNACYRRLALLVKRRLLAQTERPLIGGNRGGSGQYIYQLGTEGKKLFEQGFYQKPPRMSDLRHTLAIADVFVSLKVLEREGRYVVSGYSTEPETWLTVAGIELRPDLHVELEDHGLRRTLGWWIEVDLGTERQKQIKDKLAEYYYAWQHAEEETLSIFPIVVFLVPNEIRAKELRWLISHGPDEAQPLFDVKLQSDFPRAYLAV